MEEIGIFIFTKVASTPSLVGCLAVIFFILLSHHSYSRAISLLVTSTGLFITISVTKAFFAVERPLQAVITLSSYAFPSGHAAGSTFLAILVTNLTWQLPQRLRYAVFMMCFLTAAIISYSRVVLHVHTWPQVFAGACIGALFGLLFIHLTRAIDERDVVSEEK